MYTLTQMAAHSIKDHYCSDWITP